jgi:hypothetical protein
LNALVNRIDLSDSSIRIAESGSIAQRVHFHYVQKGTRYKMGASAFAADCVCDAIGTYFAHLH